MFCLLTYTLGLTERRYEMEINIAGIVLGLCGLFGTTAEKF